MYQKLFFLSGLPRSGSTLLQAILEQNPKFHITGNSPVCPLMWYTKATCENAVVEQFKASGTYEARHEIIKSIPKIYYKDASNYVLDKCRTWTLKQNLQLINDYITKDPKIIIMVRPIHEIVASFKKIAGNLDIPELKEENIFLPDSDPLMRPLAGVYQMQTREEYKNNVLYITYRSLVNNPDATIRKVYGFLDIDFYDHDFSNIEKRFVENDLAYGIKDLHHVRSKIQIARNDIKLHDSTVDLCNTLNEMISNLLKDEV